MVDSLHWSSSLAGVRLTTKIFSYFAMSNYLGCRRRRTQGRREAWRNTQGSCWNQRWTSCCCSSSRRKGRCRRTIWTNTKQNPYYYCISIFGSCCTYIVYCIPTSICQCWSIKKKQPKAKQNAVFAGRDTRSEDSKTRKQDKHPKQASNNNNNKGVKEKMKYTYLWYPKSKRRNEIREAWNITKNINVPFRSVHCSICYILWQTSFYIYQQSNSPLPQHFITYFLAFWHQLLHQSKSNHTIPIK